MLSGGYFGVISPEGAASILGRYRNEQEKAEQFPKDCQLLATAQRIYAHQLQQLGIVDHIIWESGGEAGGDIVERETFKSFPRLRSLIRNFISRSLAKLQQLSADELVKQRYQKYRSLGSYAVLDEAQRAAEVDRAKAVSKKPIAASSAASTGSAGPAGCLLIQHLAEEIVLGKQSLYKKLAPSNIQLVAAKVFSKSSLGMVQSSLLLLF